MVSSTVGSPTSTGWKRRSRAASVSMWVRYSSSVVAPIMCRSPRASAGFSMLEASRAPSALPAPTTMCISSMNVMMRPPDATISVSTALSRASNSPRSDEPATMAAMSRAMTCRSASVLGTSPAAMRWASPSTMAVLPTPGSPMRIGLFLVRARQHLHGAADLVVPPDHRVQPVIPSQRRQIPPKNLQRTRSRLPACHVAMLRVAICHTLYNTTTKPHIPPSCGELRVSSGGHA